MHCKYFRTYIKQIYNLRNILMKNVLTKKTMQSHIVDYHLNTEYSNTLYGIAYQQTMSTSPVLPEWFPEIRGSYEHNA